MSHRKFWAIGLAVILCLIAVTCNMGGTVEELNKTKDSLGKDSPGEAGSGTAQFVVYDYSEPDSGPGANYYTITAVRKAEGAKCEVWVEDGAGVSAADAREIAAEYDKAIYPAMLETFGFEIETEDGNRMNLLDAGDYYTNRDGKLLLLLMNIRSGSPGSGQYIAGLFNGNDLFNNTWSNKADIIYVDVRNLKTKQFYAVIAHELQHLLHFVMDLRARSTGNALVTQENWINEGLSLAAEFAYLKNHDYTGRVAQFSYSANQRNTFFVWDGDLEDYASAYLFFQWLRIQGGGSARIYRDILQSSKTGVAAVMEAAKKNSIQPDDWETLLLSWFAANYIKAPDGLYGYKREIAPLVQPVTGYGEQITVGLRPGEGVYSGQIPRSFSVGNGNIKYAGLDRISAGVHTDGQYNNGMWLLTFNTNANAGGSAEPGTVMPAIGQGNTRSASLSRSVSPGAAAAVPVSASDFLGGREVDYFIPSETRAGGYRPVSGVR